LGNSRRLLLLTPLVAWAGLLGYEAGQISVSAPSNIVDFAHSPFQVLGDNLTSDMTVYTAASGSRVVATCSMHWDWAMDAFHTAEKPERQVVNPAAHQVLRNIQARFVAISP
jgi:hypothetical protein